MLTIRRATDIDADEVGALCERAYRIDGHLDWDGAQAYSGKLRDVRARLAAGIVLACFEAERIVGSVTIAPQGSPFAQTAHPGEGEVRMLAVEFNDRGKGIAESLMIAAADVAREEGWQRLILSTERSMQTAQRLYERLGYARQPDRDWADNGHELMSYGFAL
jgi:ribosomal protein S18 acetylase RimI-like enzyme